MKDIYGNELPKENTVLKVDNFIPAKPKKKDENNWIARSKNKNLTYNNKPVMVAGALSTMLYYANAVKYKRVANPEMFYGDAAAPNQENIRGFAWVPARV